MVSRTPKAFNNYYIKLGIHQKTLYLTNRTAFEPSNEVILENVDLESLALSGVLWQVVMQQAPSEVCTSARMLAE